MSELMNQAEEDEIITVSLTLDDDEIVNCAVLTTYMVGNREYIALLPLDENDENESGDVYLYRYTEIHGEPALDNIDDDEEYEIASDAFDEWMDAQEFEGSGGDE